MTDPFRPIHKGEAYLGRLRNTETLNGMLEAARRSRELGGPRAGGGSGRGTVQPHTTVWIRAHKDLPRGSVVKVAGVIAWGPVTEEAEAAYRPGFLAGDPAAGAPFLITLEPAQGPVDDTPGDVVRAAVIGVALTRLSTPGGVVGGFAEPIADDSGKLLSVAVGPAAVLWAEEEPEGEDERWASVLLGVGTFCCTGAVTAECGGCRNQTFCLTVSGSEVYFSGTYELEHDPNAGLGCDWVGGKTNGSTFYTAWLEWNPTTGHVTVLFEYRFSPTGTVLAYAVYEGDGFSCAGGTLSLTGSSGVFDAGLLPATISVAPGACVDPGSSGGTWPSECPGGEFCVSVGSGDASGTYSLDDAGAGTAFDLASGSPAWLPNMYLSASYPPILTFSENSGPGYAIYQATGTFTCEDGGTLTLQESSGGTFPTTIAVAGGACP